MFGLKDDSITTVGVSCKGEGLYNLYCLGCASNLSSEASMLLHDWVSDTMKEFAKKKFMSCRGVMNFKPNWFLFYSLVDVFKRVFCHK